MVKIHGVRFLIFSALLIGVALVTFPMGAAQPTYYPTQTYSVTTTVNYSGAGLITPGSGTYGAGSYVYFSETTYSGYSFNGWYLNGIYEGKLSSLPIVINQNYQVIAVYSQSVNYLTLSTNGPGTTNPSGGTISYGTGSTVTITETPTSGDTFSGWYLDGSYLGTSSSLVVTMSQDHQLSAFFAGNNVSTTPTPTSMPAPTSNPNLLVPTLQFYCTSLASNSLFNVEIIGALSYSVSGLVNAGVYLSYSVTNGNTWQDFAYVQTGSYGNFTADWMPTVSGNYIIRAIYFGDNLYSAVTQTSNFAITPLENQNQNVFSVDSNSTVSSLAFDSTSDSLSFSVSGTSGTTGYSQICISKTLLPDVSKLQITLDSSTISYASYSNGNTWLITIYYHHSSHNIVMALNTPAAIGSTSPTPTSSSTSTSTMNPTSNATSNPTPSPAATASPTASPTPIPEFPLIVLPIAIAMVCLAIGATIRKRLKNHV